MKEKKVKQKEKDRAGASTLMSRSLTTNEIRNGMKEERVPRKVLNRTDKKNQCTIVNTLC